MQFQKSRRHANLGNIARARQVNRKFAYRVYASLQCPTRRICSDIISCRGLCGVHCGTHRPLHFHAQNTARFKAQVGQNYALQAKIIFALSCPHIFIVMIKFTCLLNSCSCIHSQPGVVLSAHNIFFLHFFFSFYLIVFKWWWTAGGHEDGWGSS